MSEVNTGDHKGEPMEGVKPNPNYSKFTNRTYACARCNGTGVIVTTSHRGRVGGSSLIDLVCPCCHGTGMKEVVAFKKRAGALQNGADK